MIELIVKDYLEGIFGSDVYLEKPQNLPDKFLVIDKLGSSTENFIKSATIAVQTYDETKFKTSKLNEQVKDAMMKIIERDDISHIGIDTDYPYMDERNKRYRYQAVFDITYY